MGNKYVLLRSRVPVTFDHAFASCGYDVLELYDCPEHVPIESMRDGIIKNHINKVILNKAVADKFSRVESSISNSSQSSQKTVKKL